MFFEVATETVLLLAIVAFVAGFIDSMAGGGGMLTVPALLLAGIAPVEALGTNKLQSLFGSGSATIAYAQKGHVDLKSQWRWAIWAAVGSALGAVFATVVPGEWLSAVLPVMLVAIAIYFLLKPNMDDVDRAQRITPALFGATIVPLVGFYDGLFGPGTGSFYMLAFVSLAGFGVLKATAHTKLLNFASNIGAFVIFAFAGAIYWKVGIVMGFAQIFGARLGASLAMRVGSKLIKPLLVIVCLALAVRLLWSADHPLRLLVGL